MRPKQHRRSGPWGALRAPHVGGPGSGASGSVRSGAGDDPSVSSRLARRRALKSRGTVRVPQLERPQRVDRSAESLAAIRVEQVLRLPQAPLQERLRLERREGPGDDGDDFRRRPTLPRRKSHEMAVGDRPILGRRYVPQPSLKRAKRQLLSTSQFVEAL